MKDDAFRELLTSVRQAGTIPRARLKPSRVGTFKQANIKAVRAELGQSQEEFALMIGVSVATLRNWEQGRRVAARNPRAVAEAPHRSSKRGAA